MNRSELQQRREVAVKHRAAWIEAELEVTTNQSYSIGSRSLTRANLTEIRNTIDYWTAEIERIDKILNNSGRNRVFSAVPRDL